MAKGDKKKASSSTSDEQCQNSETLQETNKSLQETVKLLTDRLNSVEETLNELKAEKQLGSSPSIHCFHQSVTLGLNSPNIEDLTFSISKSEKKTLNFLKKTISENNKPNIQHIIQLMSFAQKMIVEINITLFST